MSQEDVVDASTVAQTESGRRIRWKMLVTGAAVSLLIAGSAAWATVNVGVSRPVFVIAFLAGTYFLYRKEIPDEAINTGLNVTGVVLFVAPILFYLANVFGGQPDPIPGTDFVIASLVDLVIWGLAFSVVAVVVASIACYFKMEAKKKKRRW